MNITRFQDSPQYKKGMAGERIVEQYLHDKGYVIYRPSQEERHAFDMLAIKNKERVVIAECKTKAKRKYYPDTGVNTRNLEEYRRIIELHNIPFFLFFIDDQEGLIYGNWLDQLEIATEVYDKGRNLHYPKQEKDKWGTSITYFPLINMIQIGVLQQNYIVELQQYSQESQRQLALI